MTSKKHHIHVPLRLGSVWVAERYFYDMDPLKQDFIKAEIIGLSSYKGHRMTFQLILQSGALFSYLPTESLSRSKKESQSERDKPVLGNDVVSYKLPVRGKINCFTYDKSQSFKGTYLLTLDWPKQNDQRSLVELESGDFMWVANHKMLFNNNNELPDYKKMHSEWT